ncbi:MAG: AAA family ATPase [Thermodesulfobacteriota bacterium]|nr:AAA family ATPase [Thermodesulfobacteriota bacterium]
MQRQQLQFLYNWLNNKNRKPLIVRGARQVGKSTLVEMFAKEHHKTLCNVNLERYPELSSIFSSKDPGQILQQIEFLPNMQRITDDTLLFLDEIQAVPEAIPALRYFYEDMPEFSVVSAGSLLEFALADHTFSMPVGRIQYLHMGPMTFSEFLLAIGEENLHDFICQYESGQEIGEVLHQRLLQLLRSYYFIGGMPEAVAVFSDSHSYKAVSEVHSSIIETYRDDFPKYAGSRNLNRMLNVFNFAARNVGAKIKYSNISSQDQSVTIKKDIELLAMARVIAKVIHSNCSGLPLQADIKERVFKLLFLDIGLMNAICGLDWRNLSQTDENKIINQGAIAEQFVGQHLQAMLADKPNRELNYWLREGKSSNAELDFVVGIRGNIIPIEVKSGATGTLKSLHQFMGTKKALLAVRFDSNLPGHQQIDTVINVNKERRNVQYQLLSLPLYLVERLDSLISV